MYNETLPYNLELELYNVRAYNMRSSRASSLVIPQESNTFQGMIGRSFNQLPVEIRNTTAFIQFTNAIRNFLFDKA